VVGSFTKLLELHCWSVVSAVVLFVSHFADDRTKDPGSFFFSVDDCVYFNDIFNSLEDQQVSICL
jgi:hypothetical protein